jgi:hypothetical protein
MFCGQVIHKIVVPDDFKPKRLKPYRIPEKLKPEVDRQIHELERLGFVVKSTTPMTSPSVCVIKKDQSVRCANQHTLLDASG